MRQLPPDKRLALDFPMNATYKVSEDGCSAQLNMLTKVLDMANQGIVKEVIDAAKRAGIAKLCLLDEKFITEAIREKLEREHYD